MEQEDTLHNKTFFSNPIKIASIICFLPFLVICFIFGWKREWGLDYSIDHEVWGTLGDFIGGFLGPFFALLSVCLMYFTFRAQRILTENSDRIQQQIANNAKETQEKLSNLAIDQAEKQRFNDLFFELLHRYQDLGEELTKAYAKENEQVVVNYFDKTMEDMYNVYVSNSTYGYAVKKAERLYTEFYLANAQHLSPLFRTLYRIMELVDSSDIPTKEKLRYAKIVRAQLRESELFFLRYNCMTFYGQNFIEYINSYRLIKHLPIMSLLEFKYIKEKFGDDELTSLTLNMIFRNAWRKIYHVTVGRSERSSHITIEPTSSRYQLSVDMEYKDKAVISLQIDQSHPNRTPALKSLTKLDDDDIKLLLLGFLKEVYKYSNFSEYNDGEGKSLKFDSGVKSNVGIKTIYAFVKSDLPLRLSHSKWDTEYGII